LLRDIEKAKGAREPGTQRGTTRSHGETASTLSDLGISKHQSFRWQKLAAVPKDEFEATFAGADKPSTHGIIASNEPKKHELDLVDDRAMWLWCRLLDLERDPEIHFKPRGTLELSGLPIPGRESTRASTGSRRSPEAVVDALMVVPPRRLATSQCARTVKRQ
jgi:hypothetical protein